MVTYLQCYILHAINNSPITKWGRLEGARMEKKKVRRMRKARYVYVLMCTLSSLSICLTYQKYLLVVMSCFHSLFRALEPHPHCIPLHMHKHKVWLYSNGQCTVKIEVLGKGSWIFSFFTISKSKHKKLTPKKCCFDI